MSKIPFSFTVIPNYFKVNGWFNDHSCLIYVFWAFSKCSTTSKKVFFSHKEIELDPFEYISGRDACSTETGLTVRQIRTQQKRLLDSGILEKVPSKTTNKFTVYKWVTSIFSENRDQQNGQQVTSKRPASDHKQEARFLDVEKQQPKPLKPQKLAAAVSPEIEMKLKQLDLSQEQIDLIAQYPESRIVLAIEFVTSPHVTISKSIIQTIVWHCNSNKPPEISFKNSIFFF